MFVTLSRRNTTLVNQQLALIESLEQDEEDPQRLEQLFALDHLATRMRRTAESLVILGGTSGRAASFEELSVSDIVHAAVSEVQDYQRVRIDAAPDRMVSGTCRLRRRAPDGRADRQRPVLLAPGQPGADPGVRGGRPGGDRDHRLRSRDGRRRPGQGQRVPQAAVARSPSTPPGGWVCSWSAASPRSTASRSSSVATPTAAASSPPSRCRPRSWSPPGPSSTCRSWTPRSRSTSPRSSSSPSPTRSTTPTSSASRRPSRPSPVCPGVVRARTPPVPSRWRRRPPR